MASTKTPKIRLDQLLVEQGLAETRTKAQGLIMAGLVFSEDTKYDKAGAKVPADLALRVKGKEHPWVSRGGLKLEKGLGEANYTPDGMICIDVGASTGGFTDVLLTKGAAKVYAVDVGYGQLAHKLRVDDRVVVMERTNARRLTVEDVPDPIDLVVCDASFIGLRTVLPASMELVKEGGHLIALIKPQFEVGKSRVGKKGVVRDPALHEEVCQTMRDWIDGLPDWSVETITQSPIKGPEGNVEFLLLARKGAL